MLSIKNKIIWWIFVALCILIGIYPLAYLFMDSQSGILSTKPYELLSSNLWRTGFYAHISLGGLALLNGWSQFSAKLRNDRLSLHRKLGKVYVISVLISGICGFFVGYYATGGFISASGFMSLAVIWLTTTILAFQYVKNGDIKKHRKMMIYSYAACFAAVTLRIWLPLLTSYFGEFVPAYQIVAWLCWVPNIIVAYFITARL